MCALCGANDQAFWRTLVPGAKYSLPEAGSGYSHATFGGDDCFSDSCLSGVDDGCEEVIMPCVRVGYHAQGTTDFSG